MSRDFNPRPKKQPRRPRKPRPPRPAHTPRDRDWWELKKLVLLRPPGGEGFYQDNGTIFVITYGRCERCGERQATDAHHRILVSEGGPDKPGNLAALCRQCHDWCHHNPEDARAAGWIVRPFRDYLAVGIFRWDGALVTLDDYGGYSFAAVP